MKCTLTLVLSLLISLGLFAQTAYTFTPTTSNACDGATPITTTQNVQWNGFDCVDAALDASGQTITFTIDDTYSGNNGAALLITGTGTSTGAGVNLLPGQPGDLGVLTVNFTGDLSYISSFIPSFLSFRLPTSQGTQLISIPVGATYETCVTGNIVEGGGALELVNAHLNISPTADRDVPFDFGIEYTWTPAPGNTLLNEIAVPEVDLNATTGAYDHVLPSGAIDIFPSSGLFNVGLVDNKPTAQTLNIIKVGGQINIGGIADVRVQRSTQTDEPHNVSLLLDSVGICLGGSEFVVDTGIIMTLSRTPITYGNNVSCLGTGRGATMAIARNASQTFGEEGLGMHLWRHGSTLIVEEGAQLSLEASLAVTNVQPGEAAVAYIDVMPGARVDVTSFSSVASFTDAGARIIVRLHEGGTFNDSEASREVRQLFDVDAVSGARESLATDSYIASPSPAINGLTYVTALAGATPLSQIDVLDASGRLVERQVALAQADRYPVSLPHSGLYFIRLTDVDGRMGSLRVLNR